MLENSENIGRMIPPDGGKNRKGGRFKVEPSLSEVFESRLEKSSYWTVNARSGWIWKKKISIL